MSGDSATEASDAAFSEVRAAVDARQSFLVEAGAGAGKTYSLVETLRHLIRRRDDEDWPSHKRIACITYTNVAKDEILRRVDDHPLVFCGTIHAFCWEAIKPYQSVMRAELESVGSWDRRLREAGGIATQPVTYALGLPKLTPELITLGHSDVPRLMVRLLEYRRFRDLLADRFPVILVDEYQDSDDALVESLTRHFTGEADATRTSKRSAPVLGFFGDHWQQIYAGTCGPISSDSLVRVKKRANFRSASTIVHVLNRMRPELPQVPDRAEAGHVRVFHTNDWSTPRQTAAPWKGDLSPKDAKAALTRVREILGTSEVDGSDEPKTLMLTHRLLGVQQGYENLAAAFKNIDGLSQLEDPHIEFLVNTLEPVCEAYAERRFAAMFACLPAGGPTIRGAADKQAWTEAMNRLLDVRQSGSVGDVLALLRETKRPSLSERVQAREADVALQTGDAKSSVADFAALENVPYSEVVRFARFHRKNSAFATKHGVKGAEFEDVLVVATRGWNHYDFNLMLELAAAHESDLDEPELKRLRRNRNLFYVACSRARTRLTVLFTHEVSASALGTLEEWFGSANVHALPGLDVQR